MAKIKIDKIANLVTVEVDGEPHQFTVKELEERNTSLPDDIEEFVLEKLPKDDPNAEYGRHPLLRR